MNTRIAVIAKKNIVIGGQVSS